MEIKERAGHPAGTYTQEATEARKKLLSMLEKQLSMTHEDEELTPDEVPAIEWQSEAELIETFVQLKRYTKRHGSISLESAISDDLPPLLKKGLQLFVDGWDAALAESILEQLKESLITRYTNQQNMILEGLGALRGNDVSQAMVEKLRAFRLSDA